MSLKDKLPNFKKKTKAIIALVLVAAVCVTWFAIKKFGGASSETEITEYTVSRGNIQLTVTGSGSVEPVESYKILAMVDGDILEDYFEEGQQVSEGDLLYTIETGDLENSIQKAENSLSKAQLSYQESLESEDNLSVRSTISGVITSMDIEVGDNISNGAAVATVLDTEDLTVTLPFNASDAENIYKGEGATVVIGSSGEEIGGTVSNVSSGEYISDIGALVSDVKITFKNPGALQEGESVSVLIGDYACNSEGTIKYQDAVTIKAKTSGEVTKIYYNQGDKVGANDTIFVMENEATVVSANSAALSVQDAELSLEDTYAKLDDYNITSPIDGTIIEKDSKAGDTLDASSSSTVMAVVADMSKLTFTIDVDELDISEIEEGQEVSITADALDDQSFTGYVDNISIIGSSSDGVTTYPVDIVIEDYEGLLPGMNVNAEIIVDSAEDVLMVPVAAVQRGNYVLVKDEDAKNESSSTDTENTQDSELSASQKEAASQKEEIANKMLEKLSESAPSGYTYVAVELGLNDEDYIEITSGLNEGDTIAMIGTSETVTTTTTTTAQDAGGMGGMGGMTGGGEPPSGGGPGGGGPGGM